MPAHLARVDDEFWRTAPMSVERALRATRDARPAQQLRTRQLDRFAYTTLMARNDWKGLKHRAAAVEGDVSAQLDRVRAALSAVGTAQEILRLVRRHRSELRPFGEQDHWTAFEAGFRRSAANKGLAPRETKRILERARGLGPDTLADNGDRLVSPLGPRLRSADRVLCSRLVGANLAAAVGTLNTRTRAVVDPKAWCKSTTHGLDKHYRAVRKALAADRADVGELADGLYQYARSSLDVGARAAHVSAKTRKGGVSGQAELLIAIAVGDVLRSCIEAIAAAQVVRSVGFLDDGERNRWRTAALLPYVSKSLPKPTSVDNVVGHGLKAGQNVRVVGTVGHVNIRHLRRHAFSDATLIGAGGSELRFGVPFIKLDSGGVAPGAAVQIDGTFRRSVPWLDGHPAVVLRRVSLAALGRDSWRAWLSSEIAHVFEAVPHGLGLAWSWELGPDGAGNQLRYATWWRWERS